MEIALVVAGAAAGLLVWVGARFQASPGWPRFLTISLIALLGVTLLGLLFEPPVSLVMALLPAAAGLLAALTVFLTSAGREWRLRADLGLASLIALGLLLAANWRVDQGPIAVIIVGFGPVAGLAWQTPTAQGRWRGVAWAALLLVLMGGPALWLMTPEASLGQGSDPLTVGMYLVAYLLWPGLMTVLAGRLVYAALAGDWTQAWLRGAAFIALAAVLVAAVGGLVAYQVVWDLAMDGLSALATVTTAVLPAALAAGMLMAWALPGWRRLGALVFAGLAPLALYQVVSGGLLTARPLQLTADRAAAVAQAVEHFQAERGRYPLTLAELPPWYRTRLYEPVVLRDETWCYEGGAAFYRLGYVHRPAFGAPAEYISVKLAASAGPPPAADWVCDERLALQQANAPALP
jgi:hypothetical protein